MAFGCKNDEPRHVRSESNQKKRKTILSDWPRLQKEKSNEQFHELGAKFHSFNALDALARDHI